MAIVHYYTSTFFDEDRDDLALAIVTIPRPFMVSFDSPDSVLSYVTSELGIEVRSVGVERFGGGASGVARGLSSAFARVLERDVAEVVEFTQQVSEELLPLEFSPMQSIDLQTVLRMGSYTGLGAAMAIGTFGMTPVGILATAGSIILFGAADGIASGLREGLNDRIKRMLSR